MILLVDNYDERSAQLASELSQKGQEVKITTTGEEALIILKERKADVLVTAYDLDGMSGITLARTVRQENPTQKIALLMWSESKGSLSGYVNIVIKRGSIEGDCQAIEKLLFNK